MCGQPGQSLGQSYGQITPPRFNPMTTNPQGGPPGHFLDQWRGQAPQQPSLQNTGPGQLGGLVPPRFQPHTFAPQTPQMPGVYAGSTGTGEPALPGQAVNLPQFPQAGMPPPTMGQGQLMPPNFLFARRNTRP